MALSFPASPTVNQTYTSGSKTWIWNGTTWKSNVTSAATTLGTTAPTSPVEGQLWYDTTDGTLYIRTGDVWLESVATSAGIPANPLPSGTTAQRPSSPVIGNMRINTELNVLELYNGTSWYTLNVIAYLTATGGTITYSGNYAIHTFSTSGTFTPTFVPSGSSVEVLTIAGGGGGGWDLGGGGGAGGLLYNSAVTAIQGTAYSIVVGAGGAYSATQNTNGINGTNSTAFGITTLGGGGGGSYGTATAGSSGGSGGGGGSNTSAGGAGGAGTAGQGYAGAAGTGGLATYGVPGGGGGAGGAGATIGVGGVGIVNPIVGSTIGELITGSYWVAGGGGAADDGATTYIGVSGKGNASTNASKNPIANTGGGGYGPGTSFGGSGASGVVIIRYRYQ